MEKVCRKFAAKTARRLLFDFGKEPKTAIQVILNMDYQKSFKKVKVVFSFVPSPFSWIRL